MKYKGYTAEIKGLYGKIADISDLVTFEADSEDELYEQFKIAVDDYLFDLAHPHEWE